MCFSLRCRGDPAFFIFANRLFLAVARVGRFLIVARLRRFASRVGPRDGFERTSNGILLISVSNRGFCAASNGIWLFGRPVGDGRRGPWRC